MNIETEEHFYLEITEPKHPTGKPKYAYLRTVKFFGRPVGDEILIGGDIMFAEAFPLSRVEEVRQVLQRQIGFSYIILPWSCDSPRLAIPANLRKVLGV